MTAIAFLLWPLNDYRTRERNYHCSTEIEMYYKINMIKHFAQIFNYS